MQRAQRVEVQGAGKMEVKEAWRIAVPGLAV